MEIVHNTGIAVVQFLQLEFKGYEELMMIASHLGDPRNAFLFYFPLAYCLHKPTGIRVLWLASLSEWINALLKWVLHGERPYWWVLDPRTRHTEHVELQQFRLTCETGPGSPSGHAMVTASVVFCLVLSLIQHTKPRLYLRSIIWLLFTVFMFAVSVSRLFIATHFPHQVILGTLAGILLTFQVYKLDLQNLKLSHCLATSVVMPTSCIVTFYTLKLCSLDPQWSISLATKYCANPDWIHLDTTLFNGVYRDAGSVLGFGIFLVVSSRLLHPNGSDASSDHTEKNGSTSSGGLQHLRILFYKLPNIAASIIICQIGENIKPGLQSAEVYYLVTYIKFCVLAVVVMYVASLEWTKEGIIEEKKSD